MIWLITKYLTTAFVVVAISEVAKRSDKLGALLAALPMVTILALIWIHVESGNVEKVSKHAWYTFWYVIPTLPMFLIFPFFVQRMNFWLALFFGALITVVCFWLFAWVVGRFGIDLGV